jgi:hypothetical protein
MLKIVNYRFSSTVYIPQRVYYLNKKKLTAIPNYHLSIEKLHINIIPTPTSNTQNLSSYKNE